MVASKSLAPKGFAQQESLFESLRQALAAMAGHKGEGHSFLPEGRGKLVHRLTGEIHVQQDCIIAGFSDEPPGIVEVARRSDDLAAGFVQDRNQ